MNWSYVAGFFDGEGHFGSHTKGIWRASMAQKLSHREVIDSINDFLSDQGVRTNLFINMPNGKCPMAVLAIVNAESLELFCMGVGPFLIVKKLGAEKAIAYARRVLAKKALSKQKLSRAVSAYTGGRGMPWIWTNVRVDSRTLCNELDRLGIPRRPFGSNQFTTVPIANVQAAVDATKP